MEIDTKTALLNSAEFAVRSRGFDGFSYADLAEEVGIRKASIHYHFPTKAALSAALMDRYHTELTGRCAEIEETHDTAGKRMRALIALYRAAMNDGQTLCLCVSLIISRESLSKEATDKIRAFRRMMTRWIEEVFTLGKADLSIVGVGDPKAEARATLALLEGAHLTARAESSVQTFDEAAEILKARCL